MSTSTVEDRILERFHEKCRMAGGPRPGYMLRRDAVTCLSQDHAELDFEGGVASLVDQGLLLASESGALLYLSEAGSEAVASRGR